MKLITKTQFERMQQNGIRSQEDPDFDPEPVVKLFTPDANATWLLTELDPDDPDLAFGLCDIGHPRQVRPAGRTRPVFPTRQAPVGLCRSGLSSSVHQGMRG